MTSKEKGFGLLPVLLISVILGIIIGTGWFVWQSKKDFDNNTHSNAASVDSPKQKSSSPVAAAQPARNIEHTNDKYSLSFQYPEDWQLIEEMMDNGRGYEEGVITVVSPYGTKVAFNLTLGGKGGDCVDPVEDKRTTRRCITVEHLTVNKLATKLNSEPLYFYTVKLTSSDERGAKIKYDIGLDSDESSAPEVGSKLEPVFLSLLTAKTMVGFGNVQTEVTGKDDAINSSPEYLKSRQVEEATAILKSVSIAK